MRLRNNPIYTTKGSNKLMVGQQSECQFANDIAKKLFSQKGKMKKIQNIVKSKKINLYIYAQKEYMEMNITYGMGQGYDNDRGGSYYY